VNGSIRITEQGEVIASKYGLPDIAQRTLELTVSATLEATLRPPEAELSAKDRAEFESVMDELADTAAHHYRLWVRDEPPRPLDIVSLAAICDAFLPRIFLRLGRPVPIGTVTMTTYFHASGDEIAAQSDRHVYGIARGENFRNRFYEQSAEVWSDDGTLLATSQQLTYYRA